MKKGAKQVGEPQTSNAWFKVVYDGQSYGVPKPSPGDQVRLERETGKPASELFQADTVMVEPMAKLLWLTMRRAQLISSEVDFDTFIDGLEDIEALVKPDPTSGGGQAPPTT